jgi:GNAT superfamily N-acetyltransferase
MELARPARDEDLPACRDLLNELLAGADGMRGGPALVGRQTSETLLARWTGPDAQLFVGEFEGVVVGVLGVTASADASGSDVGPRGLVEGCYVELDARGVGVGHALLQAALAWCTEQGCREIDALALPGDRPTKQGLESAGFTARLLTLSRRLD